MIVPAHTGPFRCKHGSFEPRGKLYIVDDRGGKHATPEAREASAQAAVARVSTDVTGQGLSARLFVGLYVRGQPVWHVQEVIDEVVKYRTSMMESADSSFLLQRGVFTEDGRAQAEDSVQVVLIDLADTPAPEWERQMKGLAEDLRDKLKQQSVILEIQKKGIQQSVWWVHEPGAVWPGMENVE